MKELFAADLLAHENQSVNGYFVAASRQLRTKADGSSYLCVTLSDRTGQFDGRMWEVRDLGEFQAGDIVAVTGTVCRYQEKLQIRLDTLRGVARESSEGAYELGDFVPRTHYSVESLWARLEACVASFTDPDLRALMERILGTEQTAASLREAPAAKALHHAWIGGLLEHVVSLLELCERVARHYPEVHRDLLLTGAMLHDIGKIEELRWGTSFGYTTEGQLLGHISIGAGMVERTIAEMPGFPPRLRTLVLHLVLSHHGRYEFGSPKLPMIPEAMLLHQLDDMEAKMQTVRSELEKARANGAAPGEMTEWVRSLDRPVLDTRAYLAGSASPVGEQG